MKTMTRARADSERRGETSLAEANASRAFVTSREGAEAKECEIQ